MGARAGRLVRNAWFGGAGVSDSPAPPMISRAVTLTRERIVAYAAQFDPQPQHLDEAAAAGTGFGELVASGWQTAAVSMRLAGEAYPALAGGSYRIDSLKWQRPVRPGDTLAVEVEILVGSPPRFQITTRAITTRDGAGEAVQIVLGTILS